MSKIASNNTTFGKRWFSRSMNGRFRLCLPSGNCDDLIDRGDGDYNV